METVFRDQVVMVTGAAGSVGQELVRQLIPLGPAEIRLMDNNESELFLLSERYRPQNNVTFFWGMCGIIKRFSLWPTARTSSYIALPLNTSFFRDTIPSKRCRPTFWGLRV
jgi:hypothetical protein